MANEQNLKRRSPSEAREMGRKGGRASGAARREKKTFKAMLDAVMDMPMEELEGADPRMAICKGMILKAASGDKQAADWVRDTIGEKPTDKVDSNISGGLEIAWTK